MSDYDRERLQGIKTFPSLVKYLRDELDWPIDTDDFDQLTFDWQAEELGIDLKTSAKIQYIKQLRPLTSGQPWGIFFAMFEPKRLPVVALRRILSSLALKKRAPASRAEQPAWQKSDLLFISAYGEEEQRHITFAHFSESPGTGDLPVLRVLGWDGSDTPLHIDHVHSTLTTKLRWPGDASDLESWRESWSSAFRLRPREVITTSRQLAIRLAELARDIRQRVNSVLAEETQHGPMRRLMNAFKEALIHDLDEDDFADMYAQTVAYGLLSARISHWSPDDGGSTALAADDVAELVPVTNPFLKELMATFLSVAGRRALIDFDELGVNEVVETLRDANMGAVLRDFGDKAQRDDPVFYFYEDFIREYDPQKRKRRGIYFTPLPVVSFIVRSVDDILRTEFGLEDGLADTITWAAMAQKHKGLKMPDGVSPGEHFVQILDPACGTGTFLVEVIDLIHKTMVRKWEAQGHTRMFDIPKLWNEYVARHLLPRLYGFELMMAPYAIAHMKIGLKLYETGYTFGSDERARVYLTNSLEPPHDFSDVFEQMAPSLAHEARAANTAKEGAPTTIIIGNPPYSIQSANLTDQARAIVEPYKTVDGERIVERNALQFEKNLQDDYVKFVRLSESAIASSGAGVWGFICNNSYLDGRSFRGMRSSLTHTFGLLGIVDLHGSGKKAEASGEGRDENVFDIQQGVCITLGRKLPSLPGQVRRADLIGPRAKKYAVLATSTIHDIAPQQVRPAPPFYVFSKADSVAETEYGTWVSLRDIFGRYSSGVKTHRDRFAYAFTRREAASRLAEFADVNCTDSTLREAYKLKDTAIWALAEARKRVRTDVDQVLVVPADYRPFDKRYVLYSDRIVRYTARPTMRHILAGGNVVLLACQQQVEEGFRHVFITRTIADCCSVSNKSRETTSAFPLWLTTADDPLFRDQPSAGSLHENVSIRWLSALRGRAAGGECGSDTALHYIYALLHSVGYRDRYRSLLRSDFPRIPLPRESRLLKELATKGADLVALHLLEDGYPAASWNGAARPTAAPLVRYAADFLGTDAGEVARGYPVYKDGCVHINDASAFRCVPTAVWNFQIGSYQVCEKWLKDRRGRVLSKQDIEHYCRIVAAIRGTIRLMGQIDKVIDAHGGWPDAFITDPKVPEGLKPKKA